MRTNCLEFIDRGKLGLCELGDPPEPGPHEILMETKFSAITNGTERHAFLVEQGFGGGRFPSRHGYQQVGEIIAVGEGVARYERGDWVYYGGYVGHRGWNLVDEKDLMIELPEDIDRRHCALFGVAGVALRAVRRMGVSAGDKVWVAGQGPIGQFVSQAARAVGGLVSASDIDEDRLKVAKECGAHYIFNATRKEDEDALEAGGPYDYIFDCCGLESLFFDILDRGLLAGGGTIGALAVRDKATFPWTLLHQKQAKIEVSCHFDRDDLRVLLHLYRRGPVVIEPMVSHEVSIDEAPGIYDKLAAGSPDLLGVVFDWS